MPEHPTERDRFIHDREIPREPEVPPLSAADIDRIGRTVFMPSRPEQSDVLFVLGTSTGRWDLVAQLYHERFAPIVLVTGRQGLAYFDTHRPLAHLIRDALKEHGVPDNAILVADASDHSGDDVRLGLEVLRLHGIDPASILFACKAHHSGRVWRTFVRWCPAARLACFAYEGVYDGTPIRHTDWWEHRTARARVYGELLRIERYAARGDIAGIGV